MRPRQVHALQEGAADPLALLGLIRLVDYLAGYGQLGREPCSIIVDSGTGVTATGMLILSGCVARHPLRHS